MSLKTSVLIVTAFAIGGSARAANRVIPPAVPSAIEAPAGSKPIFAAHAVGTQNYMCVAAPTETGGEWFFLGPQATLSDDYGVQAATHFLSKNPFKGDALQATWQHSRDTSVVWATKYRGSTDPAYVAPDAIEWLLLEVTGAQVGPAGGYKLSGARFIQRVNTVGGLKPPAADCTSSTLNARRFVTYEADYYFYQ
jgi:hypothetical protein